MITNNYFQYNFEKIFNRLWEEELIKSSTPNQKTPTVYVLGGQPRSGKSKLSL